MVGDMDARAPTVGGLASARSTDRVHIRAAVLRVHGAPFALETLTLRPPGQGEVRVRIRACAVCHSDLSAADGIWGGDLPIVLGHEAAGTVEAVGSGVGRVVPGDRVVVTLIRSCQSCEQCAHSEEVLCGHVPAHGSPLETADGTSVVQGMETGAFAEAVVVDQSQLAPIPDALSFELASLLGCGVLTGFCAVANTAHVRPGQSVIVIGCGGVGLNAIQGARIAGAGPIIAIDPAAERRGQARAFGATHTFDPREGATERDALAVTDGGADAVFVAAGIADVMTDATRLLARGGQLVVLGMPPVGVMAAYEPVNLAYYGQRIVGTRMGGAVVARDVPMLAKRYLDGSLQLDSLVGGTWPLERINDAFAAARRGEGARQIVVMGA